VTIGVERVDFVSVPTRDVARARRFYGEVLGLPASSTGEDEFETPNVTLALWQPEADGVEFTPNTAGIALRVADVAAARERLAAANADNKRLYNALEPVVGSYCPGLARTPYHVHRYGARPD
jgi:catechol 2,3-dioxygenase-like lactoylglutathione lyase family enzyme